MKRKQDAKLTFPRAQNNYINYTYNNLRGWLSQVNAPELFSEDLSYRSDGNVSAQTISQWAMSEHSSNWDPVTFNYTYDNRKRLIEYYNSGNERIEHFAYDGDGNFITKIRGNTTIGFTYGEGTNKALLCTYASTAGGNSNDVSYALGYDKRGNLNLHERKGLTDFVYDRRNLPLQMTTPQGLVEFRYDDAGNRIEKSFAGETELYIRDHTGREIGVTMRDDALKYVNLFGIGSIGRVDVSCRDTTVNTPDGWLDLQIRTDARYYYLQDHLGSNRATIDTTGAVVNAQDFYAYGDLMRSYNNSTPNERYKFTGKERDNETNLDYFGARYYDSELGRWLSIDPLDSKYPGISPYVYCLNDPLNKFDPDGRKVVDAKNNIILIIRAQGQLVYGKNATAEVIRICNALNGTITGRKQLDQMINSDINVHLIISKNSGPHFGETVQGNNKGPNYGKYKKRDGTFSIKEATITIFEGTIKGHLEKEPKGNVTLDQYIGAVAGHEIVHATDLDEINADIEYEQEFHIARPGAAREKKPGSVKQKILKELEIQ